MQNPKNERIVSLRQDRREWLVWTVLFYVLLVVIAIRYTWVNLDPSTLEAGQSLIAFNASTPILIGIAIALTVFGLYAVYLIDKRMEQGFTHLQKIYFKEDQD